MGVCQLEAAHQVQSPHFLDTLLLPPTMSKQASKQIQHRAEACVPRPARNRKNFTSDVSHVHQHQAIASGHCSPRNLVGCADPIGARQAEPAASEDLPPGYGIRQSPVEEAPKPYVNPFESPG